MLEKCKHIKKEGSGCSLNNNCKYTNCSDSQQVILEQLENIVKGNET